MSTIEKKINEHLQCPHCSYQYTEEHEEMGVSENTVQGWAAGKLSENIECWECGGLFTTRMDEESGCVVIEEAEEDEY